ncbi:hypothetical protein LCGC14_1231810 [marine sediment metagenome]|uniref:Uncharacterized protein n=1 Tax=marine sediment metagenome TaxID=412755 RepID=A0A0F9PCK4_9ZZZZ
MGYSKNPAVIEKVERFLTLMVNADESLEWETTEPSKLAYYLREGISAALAAYKSDAGNETLRDFSILKSKYIIKVKGSSVIAAMRNEIPLAVMSVKRMKSVYLPNITTLTEIVGAVAKYIVEEGKEQITIPNSGLNEVEFGKLESYLKSKELKIEENGNELVITGTRKRN